MTSERNVCGVEKTVRITLGLLLLGIGLFADIATGWRVLSLVLSATALLTGIIGYCPLNKILGANSCRIKQD
ncbi:MAG TPA: DUF2892 domain-containing protein [Coleofasciculaceae cyanobacterium]|jgi:hypothetical protein